MIATALNVAPPAAFLSSTLFYAPTMEPNSQNEIVNLAGDNVSLAGLEVDWRGPAKGLYLDDVGGYLELLPSVDCSAASGKTIIVAMGVHQIVNTDKSEFFIAQGAAQYLSLQKDGIVGVGDLTTNQWTKGPWSGHDVGATWTRDKCLTTGDKWADQDEENNGTVDLSSGYGFGVAAGWHRGGTGTFSFSNKGWLLADIGEGFLGLDSNIDFSGPATIRYGSGAGASAGYGGLYIGSFDNLTVFQMNAAILWMSQLWTVNQPGESLDRSVYPPLLETT